MNRLKIYKNNNFEKGAIINVPFSKSISNRALVLSFLSKTKIDKGGFSDADDTLLLQKSLREIESHQQRASNDDYLELNLQNAGTTYRFLTSLLCLQKGNYILNCSPRMKERPISPLVDALKAFGAKISYLQKENYPPLKIEHGELSPPNTPVNIDISSSSQFVSSLLLIMAFFNNKAQIKIEGEKYSMPYVQMTLALMTDFGIETQVKNELITVFPLQKDKINRTQIEKDWSSAAFVYQFTAINKNAEVFIEGLKLSSIQGDSVLPEIFSNLGVESIEKQSGIMVKHKTDFSKNFNFDFKNTPDLAIPVIFTCAKLKVIGRFSGLKNLSVKESNRLSAMEEILALFDYDFRMINDDEAVLINSCKTIETPEEKREIFIDTKNDHRLFMASALMSTKRTKVILNYPDTYKKSFPGFLSEIEKLNYIYQLINE